MGVNLDELFEPKNNPSLGLAIVVIATAIITALFFCMGCDRLPVNPLGPDTSLDTSVASSHVATGLAYEVHLQGDSPTPDDPDNPEGCENCSDTGWLGDGRPRDACPLCNDPIKKPMPSVADYLRQLEEWRRRNGQFGTPFWSPTEEDWNKLNVTVDEIGSDLTKLELEVVELQIGEGKRPEEAPPKTPETEASQPEPPPKANARQVSEPPVESDPVAKPAAVSSLRLTMHSMPGCIPCRTWYASQAKTIAPTLRDDKWFGSIEGATVLIDRDYNHKGRPVPWWTLAKDDKPVAEFLNGTAVTRELIKKYAR